MFGNDDDGDDDIAGHGFPGLGVSPKVKKKRKVSRMYNDRMPFGKYKGQFMEELPSGYLRWLVENIKDGNIKQTAEKILDHREELEGCIAEIY